MQIGSIRSCSCAETPGGCPADEQGLLLFHVGTLKIILYLQLQAADRDKRDFGAECSFGSPSILVTLPSIVFNRYAAESQ